MCKTLLKKLLFLVCYCWLEKLSFNAVVLVNMQGSMIMRFLIE